MAPLNELSEQLLQNSALANRFPLDAVFCYTGGRKASLQSQVFIMAKVLIIGSNGQLGSECVKAFGDDCAGVDFPQIDITRAESVEDAFVERQPVVVVNCAAYTAVDKAESDAAACAVLNAEAAGILARACKKIGAFLIHVSTDYVFNGEREAPAPWLESDAPDPRSVYGATKLAGEKNIAESGVAHAILRTAWLYGANGKNFPKTMLRLALANPSKPIRVVDDQFGCPTCAADLARQIRAVAEARANGAGARGEGVFHAVSSGWTSWFGFASEFLRLMEAPHEIAPISSAEFPTPARRPANSILDAARLRELGVFAMPEWREALAEFVRLNRGALVAEQEEALRQQQ